MNDISLTRKQVLQLAEIAAKFTDAEWFTIEMSNASGIGTAVMVKFDMFKDNRKDFDTTVDITDLSTW
jgi:hypothetical protein